MKAGNVNIIEVSPRDGLQSEPEILSTDSKAVLVSRAIGAGIRRLEVASFAHPQKVPQMADAEALLAILPYSSDVSYIGLIMNERGLDRALQTAVHEIGMVVIATDTYNQRNQGVSTRESISAWLAIARRAKSNGKVANVMISSAFGCPFEGEVPMHRIIEIAKQLVDAEPAELAIADSIGVAVPNQITELVGRLQSEVGPIPLRFHLHNTRNTGLANAQAAIDAGVDSIDASIGGIGGCPFAPAATGNIPTDDLLYMLSRSGLETGVELSKIIDTSRWLEQELGREVPAMLPKAGIFPGQLAD